MIHMERRRLLSDDGDSQYNYQVHLIDNEDKLTQLIALEQQLELTEKRFRRLQNYVEYIRTLYHGSLQEVASLQMCNQPQINGGMSMGVGNLMHIPPEFNPYMFEDENFQGGGDDLFENEVLESNSFLFEPKDEVHKKKKATRKKSPKKVKTPSKKTIHEDPSQRLIDRKSRLKSEKSMATIKVPRRNSAAFSSSYLKPTVASTMKKMRPYHPNFNFRSIPFVAGKATTRSHNLGIKIQETLSIIKRNTPAEVGRCTADQASGDPAAAPNSFSRGGDDRYYDVYSSRSKCSMSSKLNVVKSSSTLSDNGPNFEGMSDISDFNGHLRKALVYIQSDFSKTLNELKELSDANDPKDADRIQQLEKSLDCKEEVILAFSKLYNQVMSLKRQLDSRYQLDIYNNMRPGSRRNISYSYPAVKLTRLLRKIQEFQNRMQGYPFTQQ